MWSPMGPKNLAVLIGVCINKVFFYKKMYGRFSWWQNNGHNDEVTVRQSSSVHAVLYEYQCT